MTPQPDHTAAPADSIDWGIPDTPSAAPTPPAPAAAPVERFPDQAAGPAPATPPAGDAPAESFENAQPVHQPIAGHGPRDLPHSLPVEEGLLGACILDMTDTADRALAAGVTPDHFYDRGHSLIFRAIAELRRRAQPVDVTFLVGQLGPEIQDVGGPAGILRLTAAAPTSALVSTYLARILELRARRELVRDSARLAENALNPDFPIIEIAAQGISQLQRIQEPGKPTIRERYQARKFNPLAPPADTPPRFSIIGRAVSSPGNLTNIIAQAKAGKTSFTSAIIAAAIVAEFDLEDRDTLGVTAEAPKSRKLIHIDTEQSPFDHHALIRLCMRRAMVSDTPAFLWSFALAGFDAKDLRATLQQLILLAAAQGGIHSIILDGSADFINDVNDPGECNPFVADLHGLAIEHNCPIINVVHENPGQDFGKMRGHLGSQLERKAESNLRLKKTDDITTVFSDRMRRAPILEKEGPRFSWSDQAHMHTSLAPAGEILNDAKRAKLRDLAAAVFEHAQKSYLRYGDFLAALQIVRRVGASYAEDRFADMKRLEVITKELATGMWQLCDR